MKTDEVKINKILFATHLQWTNIIQWNLVSKMKATCIFYLLFDFRLPIDKLIIYCILFIDVAIQWTRNGFWLSTIHQIINFDMKEIITSCKINMIWNMPSARFHLHCVFSLVDLLCTVLLVGCFSNFFIRSTILVSLWKVFIKKSCCLFCMYLFYVALFLSFFLFCRQYSMFTCHDDKRELSVLCYMLPWLLL